MQHFLKLLFYCTALAVKIAVSLSRLLFYYIVTIIKVHIKVSVYPRQAILNPNPRLRLSGFVYSNGEWGRGGGGGGREPCNMVMLRIIENIQMSSPHGVAKHARSIKLYMLILSPSALV